jgi:hypothetical protein
VERDQLTQNRALGTFPSNVAVQNEREEKSKLRSRSITQISNERRVGGRHQREQRSSEGHVDEKHQSTGAEVACSSIGSYGLKESGHPRTGPARSGRGIF